MTTAILTISSLQDAQGHHILRRNTHFQLHKDNERLERGAYEIQSSRLLVGQIVSRYTARSQTSSVVVGGSASRVDTVEDRLHLRTRNDAVGYTAKSPKMYAISQRKEKQP